jgi:hypothetical protein
VVATSQNIEMKTCSIGSEGGYLSFHNSAFLH